MVIGHSAAEVAVSDEEVARTLKAMDEFNAAFPFQESGEDLSQAARTAGPHRSNENDHDLARR
jgi:hypothetical protein